MSKTKHRNKEIPKHHERSSEADRVLREGATEPPFTGKYLYNHREGSYVCAACANPLFSSEDKFDSGSGWPSYSNMIADSAVRRIPDNSHGMQRIEIRCARCDGHLGHVFDDGPPPTGLRFCVNSAALDFVPETEGK